MALTAAEQSRKWREKNPDYDREWKASTPKKWREGP